MMNKKTPIILALPLLAVLLFAGCGGEEGSTPTRTPDIDATAPRISASEVKAKLDAGANIVIVDTRSKSSYEREHIAGAISIPEADLFDSNNDPLSPEEIAQRYSDLQRYDEIITYWGWPAEEQSARVATRFNEAGLPSTKAIRGGFNAWLKAGYPIE